MFHVKHFRPPFVGKYCTVDIVGLWKTPIGVNCATDGSAVTIGKRG